MVNMTMVLAVSLIVSAAAPIAPGPPWRALKSCELNSISQELEDGIDASAKALQAVPGDQLLVRVERVLDEAARLRSCAIELRASGKAREAFKECSEPWSRLPWLECYAAIRVLAASREKSLLAVLSRWFDDIGRVALFNKGILQEELAWAYHYLDASIVDRGGPIRWASRVLWDSQGLAVARFAAARIVSVAPCLGDSARELAEALRGSTEVRGQLLEKITLHGELDKEYVDAFVGLLVDSDFSIRKMAANKLGLRWSSGGLRVGVERVVNSKEMDVETRELIRASLQARGLTLKRVEGRWRILGELSGG
jgi:hypothetical protein